MSHHSRHGLIALAISGLALAAPGCSNDSDSPLSSGSTGRQGDQEQIRRLISASSEYADYFALDTSYGEPSGSPSLPIGLAPIVSLSGWHREQTDVAREMTINIAEGVATVEIVDTINGQLVLREEVDGEMVQHEKPLVDISRRHVTFNQVGGDAGLLNGIWKLASISNVEVQSAVDGTPPSVGIEWVLIESSLLDAILITDPMGEMRRQDIPRFRAGKEVTVTFMPSGAAGVAFLQAGGRKGVDRSRQQFDLQPDGSFRTTWTVPRNEGIFHLMVDLLTEGSLSESDADVAPYDANQWGIIYQVGDGESGHGGHHGDDDEEEEEEEEEEEDDRA